MTGQNTVFQGTGTNLDFSLSNQAGYSITVIDANHFSVPAASGSSSTTGDAYHQGYPLYGVYGSLGRFDCYDCVGSVMGIADACAPGLASAVDVISGIVSLHNHESQSPNVLNVLAGSGTGTPLYPCLVDGLHHSDILGYGVYTVNWARGIYASLNVEGGFFGRAFLMNVAAYNAFVNGTQFAAADGTAVGGTDTAYITGWWVVDGTRTVQTGPANVTPFAISTVSGPARLASTGTDGIDVWALGSTINIALSDALAGAIESSSGYLQLAAASGQSGLWLDATGRAGSNVLILRTGAANANGYFDVGINNFRHGNATNQFLTIRDGTPSPFSGAATDALISAVSQLQLSSGSATNIWCNGHRAYLHQQLRQHWFLRGKPRGTTERHWKPRFRRSPCVASQRPKLPRSHRQQHHDLTPHVAVRRVHLREVRQAAPADDGAAEGEECLVDVVAHLPADPQAAEPVQQGDGLFHHLAVGAQARTMCRTTAGDHGRMPLPRTCRAVLVMVIAPAGIDRLRRWRPATGRAPAGSPRSAASAGRCRCGCRRSRHRQRDPGLGDHVVLRARLGTIDRARPVLGCPSPPARASCQSPPWTSPAPRPRSARPAAAS